MSFGFEHCGFLPHHLALVSSRKTEGAYAYEQIELLASYAYALYKVLETRKRSSLVALAHNLP